MEVKNRIKEIMEHNGSVITPSREFLENNLAGMTMHRWNRVVRNAPDSPDLTAPEIIAISRWLMKLGFIQSETELFQATMPILPGNKRFVDPNPKTNTAA